MLCISSSFFAFLAPSFLSPALTGGRAAQCESQVSTAVFSRSWTRKSVVGSWSRLLRPPWRAAGIAADLR